MIICELMMEVKLKARHIIQKDKYILFTCTFMD